MANDNASEPTPHVEVMAQYIKDLSFENPSVPQILNKTDKPEIELSLDLNIEELEEDIFEVELAIEAKTRLEQEALFLISLRYAGIFHLINVPEAHKYPMLAIDCASIIFPFARKIIADITQEGGFRPLMVDPIDFGALYSKKVNARQN